MKKIGGVLVAAGLSSRMNDFKPLLPFEDSTISLHIVTMLKNLGVDPIVVVTGYKSEELQRHLSHTGVRFVKNERYQQTQMFDSVKLGIMSICHECERIMIMPIDVPAIMPSTIKAEMNIDALMIRTRYHGEPGHPILIRSDIALKICQYQGNRGLRGAMEESGFPLTDMDVDDLGVCFDVDTKQEYQDLIEWNYQRGKGHPIFPLLQVRLCANEVFFGPGVSQLLELIDKTGSIQEACTSMNMSYSKGRNMLKKIEQQLGFSAVQRWTGGIGGGGSTLTDEGRALLQNYKMMKDDLEKEALVVFQKYFEKGIRK